MTKLLEEGIEAILKLPEDPQNDAGELLLAIAKNEKLHYRLSLDQIEELKLAMAEADRGDFASDEDMADLRKKCGL